MEDGMEDGQTVQMKPPRAAHTGEVIMADCAPGPGVSALLLTHTIKTKTIFTWR